MFNMQLIGRNISNFRKSKNMTQSELADALGISFQAVSNWERGNSMPDIEKLPQLAELFGTTVDDILGCHSKAVDAVLKNDGELINRKDIPQGEIESVAAILKPDRVNKLIEDSADLNKQAVAYELAIKYIHDDNFLGEVAPFINESDIAKLVRAYPEKFKQLAAFMSCDDLKLAAFEKAEKNGLNSLDELLPYLDEDDVYELAAKYANIKDIAYLAPFMDEDDVSALIKKHLNML